MGPFVAAVFCMGVVMARIFPVTLVVASSLMLAVFLLFRNSSSLLFRKHALSWFWSCFRVALNPRFLE
jgi:hypothetical protein